MRPCGRSLARIHCSSETEAIGNQNMRCNCRIMHAQCRKVVQPPRRIAARLGQKRANPGIDRAKPSLMLGPETGLRKAMDEANLDSGDRVALRQRGQLQVIRLNGRELISRLNTSSKLGRTVGRKLGTRAARMTTGGLGMWFTPRATPDAIAPGSRVEICEIIPQVVEWNRSFGRRLAGWPMRNGRAMAPRT